ncbi:MAG: GxxExxY protein [Saprospiraceae bacterium]
MREDLTKKMVNDIAFRIVGLAIEVHKTLGPGLLEDIYKDCLALELRNSGLFVQIEKKIEIVYKGVEIPRHYRQDLVVENCVIVEIKAQESFAPIHKAQLLTYMKLNNIPKGLLINFNVINLTRDGLIPMVNELFKELNEGE